ncbi:hypothetical protein HO173_005288 [Letharia columbiana]|uniref:Ubiquitin-conjugating enzyme E2C-binding protein n=1 Tax=Letharia columbiana TaxID=112416 RepID=A0A8H6L5L7_9LECA|nr:uncharacterized protein HO173_005288 [Letharia columbiana]KAF6236507.1 hypothetical protein HO173_005288 [Letharia columbiana]
MSSIYLYAELLLNIRRVTIFAILPSNCNAETRVWLCHDQRTLKLKHEDEEATIELPCLVVSDANLKIPPATTREISFRLFVSDAAKLPPQAKQATDCNDPWPAFKLTSETQVACGSCSTLLVNDVKVWKHLPSAGWADMMDFWHCHKPSVNNPDDENAGNNKGYAAANALGPTAGIGVVDVSQLLISDIDCTGLETTDDQGLLNCVSCREIVGIKDKKDRYSLRLFKWSVTLQRSRGLDWETCSVQEIVSAQLLASIEDQAAYKFLAYTGEAEDSKPALVLWAFTPDLMYSTSAKPTQRAMKIFYRTITDSFKTLEKQRNRIEEFQLPSYALKILQAGLKTSTDILPQSARTHREWTIGLLDRWTPVL